MTIDDLHEHLRLEFPQVAGGYRIEKLGDGWARVRKIVGERHLRPGGTISGPAMFALADVSVYIAILAIVGPRALAVTTNCSIDFMRRPEPKDLIAETRLLKLGTQLAVGDVLIYSDGLDKPVARASMTYAIPPHST